MLLTESRLAVVAVGEKPARAGVNPSFTGIDIVTPASIETGFGTAEVRSRCCRTLTVPTLTLSSNQTT